MVGIFLLFEFQQIQQPGNKEQIQKDCNCQSYSPYKHIEERYLTENPRRKQRQKSHNDKKGEQNQKYLYYQKQGKPAFVGDVMSKPFFSTGFFSHLYFFLIFLIINPITTPHKKKVKAVPKKNIKIPVGPKLLKTGLPAKSNPRNPAKAIISITIC